MRLYGRREGRVSTCIARVQWRHPQGLTATILGGTGWVQSGQAPASHATAVGEPGQEVRQVCVGGPR